MTLELKNVSLVVEGETHIYPTDLVLAEGEFNILLGTTLAGKTSLMRLMAGLEKPTTGQLVFDNKDVTGHAVQKRDVAMVYQQFINYPNFTVYQNIASPMQLRGLNKQEIRESVERVAELLKLTPLLERSPNELSGGQQQRTALARALVKEAKLVLLDEPLANLDYKLREELREELPKLFRDTGATVVYATTEPTEALLLGGQTATMHEGRITQVGLTSEVYRNPMTQRTAQVFSDPPINVVAVQKRGGEFRLNANTCWMAEGTTASLPDGHYQMGIRPHHVTLAPAANRDGDSVDATSVTVIGRVILTELTGSESTVHAAVDGQTWISQSIGIHLLEPGNDVQLYMNPHRCFLFDQNQQLVAS